MVETNSNQSRYSWLDIGRIFAMICVIGVHHAAIGFHHMSIDPAFAPWEGAVFWLSFFKGEASTLFFMISGALLLQRERSSSIKASLQRSLNLIIPLIVWNLIYFCKDYVLHNRTFEVLSLLRSPACYHLWFIYVMIGVYIFYLLSKCFMMG